MSDQPSSTSDLSDKDRLRIEANRQRALNLRLARLTAHPYGAAKSRPPETAVAVKSHGVNVIKVSGSKFIDSGGGFLIEQRTGGSKEDEPTVDEKEPEVDSVPLPVEFDECLECGDRFADSWLMATFGYKEYLLKDCDLDKREPVLKFISRKNPHNVRWGEMKLYLHIQIEERALQVWGSEENLVKEKELRDEKREVTKVKKYNKRLKELRMDMRSSLYDKRETSKAHTHSWDEDEVYNEEEDTYTRKCESCGHQETYEKM
ncbi:hypothetical protein pipiens_005117 [Culex pipiens pipiens]|uniref:XPA C-terminal domain-containing protein n=1 Tax=Culex pipiens pipiens TaxID=38569 RepID=A0ABD1CBV5_CULPP